MARGDGLKNVNIRVCSDASDKLMKLRPLYCDCAFLLLFAELMSEGDLVLGVGIVQAQHGVIIIINKRIDLDERRV